MEEKELNDQISKFIAEVGYQIHRRPPIFMQKVMEAEQKCLIDAGEDPDFYAACMKRLNKQTEYHEYLMGYKIDYSIKKAIECIKENLKNPSALQKCKDNAMAQIEKHVKDFQNSL